MDCEVIQGDCLKILPTLALASVDAVIVDPPYSSGGMFRGDRARSTDNKYTQKESRGRRADFQGDSLDQRSWLRWCYWWLAECRRVAKEGAYLLQFTDWRQLPATTDAIQAAGWTWRGVAAWNKGPSARMASPNHFRHQCEFIVWGTNLGMPTGRVGPFPGCFTHTVRQSDKHHQAGKPTPLLRDLVRVVSPGGLILDCFAGSGTTGVAALLEGRRAILIEKDPKFVEICRRRLKEMR